MRIHNLYTDANGQSHFRDIEIEWAEERRGSKLSQEFPATGVIFRQVPAAYECTLAEASRMGATISHERSTASSRTGTTFSAGGGGSGTSVTVGAGLGGADVAPGSRS